MLLQNWFLIHCELFVWNLINSLKKIRISIMFQISSKMVVARSLARTSASSAISTSGLKHFAPTPNLEDIPGKVFFLIFLFELFLPFSISFHFFLTSISFSFYSIGFYYFSTWNSNSLFYLDIYNLYTLSISNFAYKIYPFSILTLLSLDLRIEVFYSYRGSLPNATFGSGKNSH